MATLQERHRVTNLAAVKRTLAPDRVAVLDRLIAAGVLEDKALRAVNRGITDTQVTANIAANRPPHWVEFQDPKLLAADKARVAKFANVDVQGPSRDPNAGYGKVGV